MLNTQSISRTRIITNPFYYSVASSECWNSQASKTLLAMNDPNTPLRLSLISYGYTDADQRARANWQRLIHDAKFSWSGKRLTNSIFEVRTALQALCFYGQDDATINHYYVGGFMIDHMCRLTLYLWSSLSHKDYVMVVLPTPSTQVHLRFTATSHNPQIKAYDIHLDPRRHPAMLPPTRVREWHNLALTDHPYYILEFPFALAGDGEPTDLLFHCAYCRNGTTYIPTASYWQVYCPASVEYKTRPTR